MPSKSKSQHNLMAAVANNPAFAKKVGISKSIGEEFMKADKTKKFGSGKLVKKLDTSKNPGLSKLPTEVRNKMGFMKKGGMSKSDSKEETKMDKTQDKSLIKKAFKMHDSQEHKGEHTKLDALKKGGMAKKMAKGWGYSKGGQLAKANGVATKGKTKGTMVAMRSGGKTKSKMC